mmetsp:Transcript_22829/g.67157  ORF Transcript_22829/g.67157 Transcript_22829/m.67157 type:complete len:201 (+) Transcript_22829:1077-1679(+)
MPVHTPPPPAAAALALRTRCKPPVAAQADVAFGGARVALTPLHPVPSDTRATPRAARRGSVRGTAGGLAQRQAQRWLARRVGGGRGGRGRGARGGGGGGRHPAAWWLGPPLARAARTSTALAHERLVPRALAVGSPQGARFLGVAARAFRRTGGGGPRRDLASCHTLSSSLAKAALCEHSEQLSVPCAVHIAALVCHCVG